MRAFIFKLDIVFAMDLFDQTKLTLVQEGRKKISLTEKDTNTKCVRPCRPKAKTYRNRSCDFSICAAVE